MANAPARALVGGAGVERSPHTERRASAERAAASSAAIWLRAPCSAPSAAGQETVPARLVGLLAAAPFAAAPAEGLRAAGDDAVAAGCGDGDAASVAACGSGACDDFEDAELEEDGRELRELRELPELAALLLPADVRPRARPRGEELSAALAEALDSRGAPAPAAAAPPTTPWNFSASSCESAVPLTAPLARLDLDIGTPTTKADPPPPAVAGLPITLPDNGSISGLRPSGDICNDSCHWW
mmetsp:Transcript_41573/g.120002  ORF Transcript_41573/g.120002 Transcript_41573/m.120002 type:complete len:242 (-) Transcript_41573:4968-5693(-)